MTSSSGWTSLLKQLTDLRETFTYVYQFIIKSIIKDTDEHREEEVKVCG